MYPKIQEILKPKESENFKIEHFEESTKGCISNTMFTIQHIRSNQSNQLVHIIWGWLWNKMQMRKMKRTVDMFEQHFLRDCYHSKIIPKSNIYKRSKKHK